MTWIFTQTNGEDHSFLATHQTLSPPPLSISLSSPSLANNYQKSSSNNKISPAVLFIIVILAVIFFISGLLHLLVRFLIKKPTSSSSTNRSTEVSQSADALQRQLQQLFNLHDSGLDQAFIDSLPVFLYKSIVGLKEPFDCAVCLCEFGEDDKLRLLPNCSHAFHIDCIDTWLLSNSTCPLCRGALFSCDFSPIDEDPSLDFGESRMEDDGLRTVEQKSGEVGVERDEIVVGVSAGVAEQKIACVADQKIVSVKLGKLRTLNDGGEETSSSNLDARRCYSMGSFQYVLGNSNLQVALFPISSLSEHGDGHQEQNPSRNVDLEAKKLSNGGKMESFSVSKIWLWSNKEKYPTSTSDHNMGSSSKDDFRLVPPWIEEHRNSSSKV